MVLKRVYIQNTLYYLLILLLSSWLVNDENNASVLAFWFLSMIYYIYLTTQLNHTRNDSMILKSGNQNINNFKRYIKKIFILNCYKNR